MIKYLFLFFLPATIFSQTRYVDDIFPSAFKTTYEYSNKGGESLQLDFYSSKDDSLKNRPLVVFMHGGGFSTGYRNDAEITKLAKAFAKKGYPVASISYRLTRKGKGFGCDTPVKEKLEAFKLAGEDLLDAVCFLSDKKERFKIDPSKIVLAGSSAGAEGILIATYNKSLFFKNNDRYKNIKPVAVVSLAGAILNVDQITKTNAVPGVFFHGTEDPLVPYATASHHYCDPEKSGYMILHGSKSITDKLKTLNSNYLLYSIKNAKHDIFEITEEKLKVIFDFLNTVVIHKKGYQKSILR
ncbi:alpha/beta hydrolase fold domain-containing protein [Flavobacteriaceae bacterium R38]|nr:alpha/beta hydrolase fold domain-containing protein [Flavobacteriaceae bacterium R38]